MILIIILIILHVVLICLGFKVVPQNYVGLVEILGKYSKSVNAGPTFIVLIFQSIRKVSLVLQSLVN